MTYACVKPNNEEGALKNPSINARTLRAYKA